MSLSGELEIGRKRRGDSHLLRSFYAATNSEKLSDASIHHFQRDKVLGRVCKLEPAGYTRRYETKRTYKHAMEAAPTAASASKTSNGTTCFGPSTHHQRHLVDSTYRCPMAVCPSAMVVGAPWPAASIAGKKPVSGNVSLRRYNSKPMPRAKSTGTFIMSMARSCEPISMQRARREPKPEALGRSQGGFSTKVHLRAADETHLMTFVLSPGQRHELLDLNR